MSIIEITSNKIKQCIINAAVGEGDDVAVYAFGPDADNWKGSTSEIGKNRSMMVMLNGIADSITGSQSPTGEFSSVKSNNYIAGSLHGVDGDVSVVSSIQLGGLGIEYKNRILTFSKGLLVNIGSESNWINL
jgi:hypothetical protein